MFLSAQSINKLTIELHTPESTPAGMVWMPGITELGPIQTNPASAPEKTTGFWLDRNEVTNREFKEFVDNGGYRKREYWKHAFTKESKALTWEQAMAEFRDATGRPGPAAWQLGSYKEGEADFPVGGVSWYEAAAYALWSKDLGRSIDYLETRPDIDTQKLAFFGISFGAAAAPRLVAVETRFKTAILISGGSWEKVPPAVDPWNFAPRFKVPVLMLSGRDDFSFPLEASQLPLLRQLGTPEKDKKHVLFDGGHASPLTRLDMVKEALDWLDRYLGPVNVGAQ